MQGSTTASFHVHCHSFFTHRYINGLYAVYTNKQKRNKVLPTTGHEGPEVEYRCIPTLSLTSALDGDGGKGHDPAALHPRKDAVPVVQQDGWAPGPGWTGAEFCTVENIINYSAQEGVILLKFDIIVC